MSGISSVSTAGTNAVAGANTSPAVTLPNDFDAAEYLEMNPDVRAEADKNGLNALDFAAQHYVQWGHAEGRILSRPPATISSDSTAFSPRDTSNLNLRAYSGNLPTTAIDDESDVIIPIKLETIEANIAKFEQEIADLISQGKDPLAAREDYLGALQEGIQYFQQKDPTNPKLESAIQSLKDTASPFIDRLGTSGGQTPSDQDKQDWTDQLVAGKRPKDVWVDIVTNKSTNPDILRIQGELHEVAREQLKNPGDRENTLKFIHLHEQEIAILEAQDPTNPRLADLQAVIKDVIAAKWIEGSGPADLSSLTPQQQQQYRMIEQALPPDAAEDLKVLLNDRKLTTTDAMGGTLLSNLAARVGAPLQDAVSKQGVAAADLLAEVIHDVTYPSQNKQGLASSTCVSASVQTLLANDNPAEYARVVTGLCFDGRVALGTPGDTADVPEMTLSSSGFGLFDDRSIMDSAVQGSFNDYAIKTSAGDGADFEGRRKPVSSSGAGAAQSTSSTAFGGRRKPVLSSGAGAAQSTSSTAFAGRAKPVLSSGAGAVQSTSARGYAGSTEDAGLTAMQAATLYSDVLGRPSVGVSVKDADVNLVMNAVTASLSAGEPVSVGLNLGNGDHHMVSVVDVKDGQVTYADSLAGHNIRVSQQEFEAMWEVAVIEAPYLPVVADDGVEEG